MNKLEYDNLYKFFVSLGIILIMLPMLTLIYLYNKKPILISQTEYNALSKYSLQIINNQTKLLNFFIIILPCFIIIFFLLGIFSFFYGIKKWLKIQKKLDCKLDCEIISKFLDLFTATNNEKFEYKEKEIIRDNDDDIYSKDIKLSKNSSSNILERYYKLENLCFNYFFKKYHKKYNFKNNIKINNVFFDFIGVSKFDNVDLLFDIKYFRNKINISNFLYKDLPNILKNGIEYQTRTNRDFKYIIVLITPEKYLSNFEKSINEYYNNNQRDFFKLEIKCISEESL